MEPTDWNALSPAAMWRDWIARSEAQWSEAVSQLLKDPRAGQALNRQLEELRMAHRLGSEITQAALASANLVSRSDLESLDERLGRLEDGLAAVAAELSQLRETLAGVAPAAAVPRPARDRRAQAGEGAGASKKTSSRGAARSRADSAPSPRKKA